MYMFALGTVESGSMSSWGLMNNGQCTKGTAPYESMFGTMRI